VETVVADRQYGTAENYRACYERGIRSHMGDMREAQVNTGRRKGIYSVEEFEYDAQSDTYRCPAGQIMKRRKQKVNRGGYEYGCSVAVCRGCEKRGRCTRAGAGMGRRILRHYGQDAIDAGRAQSRSWEARRDRARRLWLVEGSFADAANNHGFKRARWRRLWRQRIQDYMIAAIQNIRILLKSSERGRQAAQIRLAGLVHGRIAAFLCPRRWWEKHLGLLFYGLGGYRWRPGLETKFRGIFAYCL